MTMLVQHDWCPFCRRTTKQEFNETTLYFICFECKRLLVQEKPPTTEGKPPANDIGRRVLAFYDDGQYLCEGTVEDQAEDSSWYVISDDDQKIPWWKFWKRPRRWVLKRKQFIFLKDTEPA